MSKQTRKKSSKATAPTKPAAKTRVAAKAGAAKSGARSATATPKASAKKPAKAAAKPVTKRVTKAATKTAAKAPAKKSVKAPAKASAPDARKLAGKTLTLRAAPPEPADTRTREARPEAKSLPKTPAAKPAAAGATKSAPARSTGLNAGDKAPGFRLPRDGGAEVALSDFAGRTLVIYFYPRADTPGCTREAIDFSRLAPDFEAAGASVLGVSADSLKAQEAFRDKHMLQTPLISDEAHAMLEAYGAWGEKSMYGRTFQGVLRSTVVIGKDGRVARIWPAVKVDGHADEVLAFVQSL
jgi:peroxiredoxin Q/BCP